MVHIAFWLTLVPHPPLGEHVNQETNLVAVACPIIEGESGYQESHLSWRGFICSLSQEWRFRYCCFGKDSKTVKGSCGFQCKDDEQCALGSGTSVSNMIFFQFSGMANLQFMIKFLIMRLIMRLEFYTDMCNWLTPQIGWPKNKSNNQHERHKVVTLNLLKGLSTSTRVTNYSKLISPLFIHNLHILQSNLVSTTPLIRHPWYYDTFLCDQNF
jgi:hypothetical protein